MRYLVLLMVPAVLCGCLTPCSPDACGEEPRLGAENWVGDDFAWVRGANYIPSYASNTIEQWAEYEPETIERELALARTRKTLDVDVKAASREILAGLDRLQEVLEKGSVAEVKAILRAYIGRVEYDHKKNRARVGFLRLPTRALISKLAPESARISVVAGAGFEPATFGL